MSSKTLKILIIGIGTGDPEQLTIQAVKALNRADVLFIPQKGPERVALARRRAEICERYIERPYRTVDFTMPARAGTTGDYRGAVEAWHARIAETYERLLTVELADGECGAFLVWGDPTLYDGTLGIVETLRARGLPLDYEVIPGIGSVQALAARHRIPLNRIGEPVLITTGRRLPEALEDDVGSIVVLLDGEQALGRIDRDDLDIYWGAYLGTEEELLVAGRLVEVRDEIERLRERARRKNGWIMDSYLLRRSEP